MIFGGLCGTFCLGFSNFQIGSNCIYIVIVIKKVMSVQTNIDSENKCFRDSHSSALRYFTHFPTLLFCVVFVFSEQNQQGACNRQRNLHLSKAYLHKASTIYLLYTSVQVIQEDRYGKEQMAQ